jgi:hypothetical protein
MAIYDERQADFTLKRERETGVTLAGARHICAHTAFVCRYASKPALPDS